MKLRKSKAVRSNEATGYAEIGTYLHKNPGKATVKTYTSVNAPLAVDAAVETQQVRKIRVETHVYEDKSVNGNVVYQKDVESIQLSDNDAPVSGSGPTMNANEPTPNGDAPVSDDFKKWCKNAWKNNSAWTMVLAGGVILAIALAAVAIGMSI